MKTAEPPILAAWLQERLTAFEFGGEAHPSMRSLALTIGLTEEVSDIVFQNLRIELLTPLAKEVYSTIVFEVEDALSHAGPRPWYLLRLVPPEIEITDEKSGRTYVVRDFNDFLALHAQMRVLERDWQSGYCAVRLYHANHREAAVRIENARYLPLPDVRPEDVFSQLVAHATGPANDMALTELLALADAAFDDPDPAPLSRPEPTLAELGLPDEGTLIVLLALADMDGRHATVPDAACAEEVPEDEARTVPVQRPTDAEVDRNWTLLDASGEEPVEEFVLDDNLDWMIAAGEATEEVILTPAELDEIGEDLQRLGRLSTCQ